MIVGVLAKGESLEDVHGRWRDRELLEALVRERGLVVKTAALGMAGCLLEPEAAVAPVGGVDRGAHVGVEAFVGVGDLVIPAAALFVAGVATQTKAAVSP